MNGTIEKKTLITSRNRARLEKMRKEYINGIDTGRETFDQMAQSYEMQRGRSGWYRHAAGNTGATGQNDDVDVETSGSDTFGSTWESFGYRSWEEFNEAIERGAMFIDDDGNIYAKDQFQSRDYLGKNVTNKYSYEWFAAKPDMEITIIDDSGSYRNNQARKYVANLAVENAKKVGTVDAFGNAVVHVTDNSSDVVISKSGIKHSLDRRADVVGPVAEKAGEILKNAIQINELNPRKSNIKNSYILMGVAKNKKNEPYIVSFVVNRYTHELVEMEVVYSMNAKTEPAGSLSPRITTQNAGSFTDSKITIADYLNFVNEFFADVMPEAVLKHYGYDARPDGILGKDVLQDKGRSCVF